MTKSHLALVHDASAPITPDQLDDRTGEPRVRDLLLGEMLGFSEARAIRKIIGRNLPELASHGEVRDAVSQTSEDGGRPGKEYWLNEGQALVICALSRTPAAAAVRKQMIDVFLAYRRGLLPVEDEARQTLAHLAAEVAELRQRVALIGAAPHIRSIYKSGYLPSTVQLMVSDISTEFGAEGRIFDARLSTQLGLVHEGAVRALVQSHRSLLSGLGRLRGVDIPGAKLQLGRPARSYWLTELQALAVCNCISGNVANHARTRIIRVFAEFRRQQEERAAAGGFIKTQNQAELISQMDERLAALEGEAQRSSRKEVKRQIAVLEAEHRAKTPSAGLLYGTKPIASYLSMKPSQTSHRIATGEIPTFRIGDTVCARIADLDQWIEEMAVGGRSIPAGVRGGRA
ncbi:hypothetical protein [Aureimonas sp. D3]|uniref:hypothetical protein n=1 Tax=Aureimonas sp. D3 TaxID=1638164 RepID=UPI0007820558|nr:hypothetical protein [Aureimonas sp. D3]